MRTQEIVCVKGPAQLMAADVGRGAPPSHCLFTKAASVCLDSASHPTPEGWGAQEANPHIGSGLNTEARGSPDTWHAHVEMYLGAKGNRKHQEAALWWPQPGLWAFF